MELSELLAYLLEKQGSDIHLIVGQPPTFRVNGYLERREEDAPLDAAAIESLLLPHLNEEQRNLLERAHRDVDTTLRQGDRRFRTHIFRDSGGLGAAIRIIPNTVPTLEQLGILEHVPVIEKLTHLKRGLIVITGPVGSGKTTTCAAMLEQINQTRGERIITLEDPIEYEFQSKKSLISQRSVGEDIASYPDGLRCALYMDPDVILVDRLRDLETMLMAITAAETGHLVFATMNVPTASGAIQRIIESFPPGGQQNVVRTLLSNNLQAVIAQMLIPRSTGHGRITANEVLICTPRIREMIRSGATDFTLAMEAHREIMQTMDDSLVSLAEKSIISREMARSRMVDRNRLTSPAEEDALA
jgi:twitching motility protein PilT